MRTSLLRLIPAAAAIAAALPQTIRAQEAKGSGSVALRAARVIDGTGAAAIQNGVVVITDDKIVAVGKQGSVTIPAGAKIIDLGNSTLLPGFIDAHTHIIGRTLGDPAGDAHRPWNTWLGTTSNRSPRANRCRASSTTRA